MNTEKNIIEEFSVWQKQLGKADGTIKTYIGVLEKFEAWLSSKGKSLNSVSKNDVQLYMDELENQQKTAGTIEKYLAAISVFVRFIDKSEIVLDIKRKEKIKDTSIPESLEESEEKKLLLEVKADGNLRNIAIVYTLLYTGIRISELCALNFDDIQEVDGKKKLLIKDHDGEIDRFIPLTTDVSYHLENYIDSLTIKKDAIFVSSVNKRLSTRAVQYMLQKYDVNPHKLRHTFCQKLINKGINLHIVAKLAGHKDVNVTKRYVGNTQPNLDNAIDQAFS
ncbi:tyrosine-type recombinase/integrase [Metabacillus litoralis]|uniref:tyrosine-type recombinase/integrase n=1 Tax=Metabacillus TaxID=2675233 RepID=UPI000EF5E598|nr:tyrosine-type recombinase/integrase [Metabacillus litoralis]MCM3160111.1 tyrosine-type recombinase/integrase [Metabacillus litoralis]MCM3408695.1 tyrosine-type recombinase/integrase [Metabacillus litoralis]